MTTVWSILGLAALFVAFGLLRPGAGRGCGGDCGGACGLEPGACYAAGGPGPGGAPPGRET